MGQMSSRRSLQTNTLGLTSPPRQTERARAFKDKDEGAQTHLDGEKWGILMVGVKKKESGVERERGRGGEASGAVTLSSANCRDTNLTNAIWNRLQVDRPN